MSVLYFDILEEGAADVRTDEVNVLVLVEEYPDGHGKINRMYVHTRNKYYREHGVNVTVLCSRASDNYVLDGVPVITPEQYEREHKKYDVLVCHAPHLRKHYPFLIKHGKEFPKFVFFFHGAEVKKRIKKESDVPAYSYCKRHGIKRFAIEAALNIFDNFKLFVWRHYLPRVISKSTLVFVSRSLRDEFLFYTKIPFDAIKDSYVIIHNGVERPFEEAAYDWDAPKTYDFITVRGILDGWHYSIDIVNELAKNNPEMKFLVVGKGQFFHYNEKAPNIEWKDQTMRHEEIVGWLQKARCALMPTREDTQGLMSCEMASIGMPLITSDIPVCHEVFGDFDNVTLIDNENTRIDLNDICRALEKKEPFAENDRYYAVNTIAREVDLIKRLGRPEARGE